MIGPGGAAGVVAGRGRFGAKVDITGGGGGGGATYPNEPAGMTVATQYEGDSLNPAIGASDWGGWFNEPDITVVADGSSPGPTGSVLEFNYDVGDSSAGVRTADTWSGGPFDIQYIMYRAKMVSPWEDTADSKIFYWGAHPDSRNNVSTPTQYYATYQDGPSTMQVTGQNSAPNTHNMLTMTGFWTGEVGEWVNVEFVFESESSPGAADGSIYVYKNGVLVDSNVGTQQFVNGSDPSVGFSGMQWYNTSGHVAGVSRQLRIAELYVSGKAAA